MKKRGQNRSFSLPNFSSKNLRGLSTVIVTLILILVSVVAVGVVWVVVRNVIQTGTEEVGLSQFSLSAKIMDVRVNDSLNNVSLIVKRNAGQGDLSGISFVFSSNTNTEVVTRNVSLKELEERRFYFNLNMSVSDLISISIVPIIKQDEKQISGIALDKYNFIGNTNNPFICAPSNCSILGYACGTWNNGTCSGNLNCGTCGTGQTCNVSGRCVLGACTPSLSCTALNYECGNTWVNGTCSGNLNCGTCSSGSACNSTGRCVDTTPPVLSNGAPSGTLSAGTTQTTISLSTNENAICRYSTFAGNSYASMTNAFTITGGTSHSRLITGLQNGVAYSYYVRCNDTAGNFNTNDYTISFSVPNPSCIPATCLALGYTCGVYANGTCLGTIICGTCGTGYNCVGGSCACIPTTCSALGYNCGSGYANGTCTGGTLSCGSCGTGQTCTSGHCVTSTGAIIIDHTTTNLSKIPIYWIEEAKKLTFQYAHRSDGNNIFEGLGYLYSMNSTFRYNYGSNVLPAQTNPIGIRMMDGNPPEPQYSLPNDYWGDAAARTATQNNWNTGLYNYSMWSWCDEGTYYSLAQTQSYLDIMNGMEPSYLSGKFIYMTSYTENSDPETLANNALIRNYAIANGKILYDFEDIGKYDPNGVYYPNADRACTWCTSWCASHPSDCVNLPSCSHSHGFSCVQKGKAFWWMMARIAGWNGTS